MVRPRRGARDEAHQSARRTRSHRKSLNRKCLSFNGFSEQSAPICTKSTTTPATKLIWLALRNITADWGRAAKEWREAMNQFAILYEERFTAAHAGR